jgi:hypothetical protein
MACRSRRTSAGGWKNIVNAEKLIKIYGDRLVSSRRKTASVSGRLKQAAAAAMARSRSKYLSTLEPGICFVSPFFSSLSSHRGTAPICERKISRSNNQ